MLHKAGRLPFERDMGGFVVRPNMPGWLLPWPRDHGHGPLAMVVESLLSPGRLIAIHEHRNDEIISWVPEGVMRHEDPTSGELVIDRDHLIVMNAGASFWHSDRTLPTDPPLRMLQILVRPRALDLDAMVQYGPIDAAPTNSWRHLCGPEGSVAPFVLRSAIDFFDIRLDEGARVDFPARPAWDLYFYVFAGAIAAGGKTFGEGEQGLLRGGGALALEANAPATLVAFLIDPNATVMRAGIVGDTKQVPPPFAARPLLWLAGARQRWRARRR
jgi:redox-sensitive bicupin YhaK (pirin superfamily)